MGIPKGRKCINKNGIEQRVSPDRVDEFLKNGWELGKSKKTKQKQSESHKGEKNGMYRKHHSEETRQKQSKSSKGSISWNKGIPRSEETRQKISETKKGKTSSEEACQNMSIAAQKRVEENGGGANFNKNSIPHFKNFDKENNTKGLYGKNEFHIPGTRFKVDYFNLDLKLIIEWDEEKHYQNNQLRKKDVKRQKEIQEVFPNFEFRRIREREVA